MASKAQRKLNMFVKKFNGSLKEDAWLGLGRFHIRHKFKVGRGYETMYFYDLVDTKTCETKEVWVNDYNYRRILFWAMNNFIVTIRTREATPCQ